MVSVVKWLRHRIVVPTFAGSTPVIHPLKPPFSNENGGSLYADSTQYISSRKHSSISTETGYRENDWQLAQIIHIHQNNGGVVVTPANIGCVHQFITGTPIVFGL